MTEQKTRGVVIVGAGMAGVQTAVRLREEGWEGPVELIGAEPHRPYDRPPLSKAVLLGQEESSAFDVDFDALGVDLRLDTTVTGLRPDRRTVEVDGAEVPYDALVVATGAVPLTLPGSGEATGVHLLRTVDDAARLRPILAERQTVVVVGAGWIGAELATAAKESGCEVTVVEAADRPLPGAVPADVSVHMRRWYEEHGVRLLTSTRVAAVESGAVLLADGDRLPADAVVVGVGARPATDWLAGSGVALGADGAVLADERLRTSVPGVYAVGDCASFPSARFGARLLVHHWDNALQGPRVVAANVVADLGGAAGGAVYDPVPYFWSEQFGRFVQYAGHHADGDRMLWRGDPRQPAWSVCWLRGETLTAVLAVGRPRDLAQGRRLIQSGAAVDATVLADASVPLKKAAR